MNRSRVSTLAVLFASTALAVSCCAQSNSSSALIHSAAASSPPEAVASLPDVFAPVLTEVKAKSRIAVLLPSQLSRPLIQAKYAVVERVVKGDYAISLNYKLDIGDAGFAALFAAEAHPGY